MKKLLFVFLAFFVSTPTCFAQNTSPSDAEVVALLDFINSTVNGVVNANTLFTSQDEVSSGLFKFDSEDGGPRSRYRVDKIPFRWTFCDPAESSVRPYVRGRIGHAALTEVVLPVEGATGESDFSGVYTWSFSLGGGADIEIFDNFVLTPDFGATYSRVHNKYGYKNDVSAVIGYYLDGHIFNWDLDVMTWTPSIKAQYTIPMQAFNTILQSSYAHLINKSFRSTSNIIDIDSSTNLVRNMIQFDVPTGQTLADAPINARPFFARSEIGGAARQALGFSHFYETGLEVAFKVQDKLPLLTELSVGGSYSWADNMEGVRLGIGGVF